MSRFFIFFALLGCTFAVSLHFDMQRAEYSDVKIHKAKKEKCKSYQDKKNYNYTNNEPESRNIYKYYQNTSHIQTYYKYYASFQNK